MSQDQSDTRTTLLRTLISKVEEDPYPSTTMMDLIEELLTPEDVPAYADILMRRIEADRFPSMPMIARLRDLNVG